MTRSSRRRARLLLSITALAVGLAALSAATAGAATTNKLYSASVAGQGASGARSQFTFTIQNLNTQQLLGSANITAPSGFALVPTLVSTSRGTVSASSSSVQLRNLGLASTDPPLTVTITADVACGAASPASWAIRAKQSNDFNGPPGNDFTLASDPSLLQTTVTGSCSLSWTAPQAVQPANARTGATITSTPFNSPPGVSPAVVVLDGNGQPVTSSSATVTLSYAYPPTSGIGTLSGGSATAINGVATFSSLSIGAAGTYALTARSPGIADSAPSSTVVISDFGTACDPTATCTGSLTGGGSKTNLEVSAPPAGDTSTTYLTISGLIGTSGIDCAGYTELTADTFVIDGTSPLRGKTVTMTIDKKAMQASPNNGAAFLQLCYAQPASLGAFATAPGFPAAELKPGLIDWNHDGSPDDTYVGLLPDCPVAGQACVLKRQKTGTGYGIVQFSIPSGQTDPAGRG